MEAITASAVRQFRITRVSNAQSEGVIDSVAAEEPLEIRVRYWSKDAQVSDSVALTMRTPGNDRELAAGFLLSEGIITDEKQLLDLHPLGTEPSNEIVAELAKGVDFDAWRLARTTFVNSACGVCGKRSRDALVPEIPEHSESEFRISTSMLGDLPAQLRERQHAFTETGALHAAALVNSRGIIEQIFEDIGRHNALDKLLGWRLLNGSIPISNHLLLMSSRSSFELIQKAIMAGAPALATVGGPSSLAIEAARENNLTLIGFLRDCRFNIYAGGWRINS